MSYVTFNSKGKPQLAKTKSFCMLLNNMLPESTKLFTELQAGFDLAIKEDYPEISQGALNNAHGDWYEWLLAISAWNYHVDNPAWPKLDKQIAHR